MEGLFTFVLGDVPSKFQAPKDSLRILVVGDSGVGKTCLVHLLCHGEPVASNPSYTVGCDVDVFVHGVGKKSFFVELFEVGGSAAFESSRGMWYQAPCVDGIVCVHDVNNINSRNNLDTWLREVLQLAGLDILPWTSTSHSNVPNFSSPPPQSPQSSSSPLLHRLYLDLSLHPDPRLSGRILPVLIVANKTDLLARRAAHPPLAARDDFFLCSLNSTLLQSDEAKAPVSHFLDAVVHLRSSTNTRRSLKLSSGPNNNNNNNNNNLQSPVKLGLGLPTPYDERRRKNANYVEDSSEARLRIDL